MYRATYSQIGTDTGRLSSPFQQVPRPVAGEPNIRNAVVAPPGHVLIEADYSMLELRLIAWRAREESMLKLLRDDADIHAYSGLALWGLSDPKQLWEGHRKVSRQTGKTVNYSLGYEAGSDKLAEIMLLNMSEADIAKVIENFEVDSLNDLAAILRGRWHATYPGVRRWHAEEKARIRAAGKAIAPHGRIKHVPKIFSRDPKERAEGFREGINHVIQSPASDLTLLAATMFAEVQADYGVVAGPWPSHDSLLFVVQERGAQAAGEALRAIMEDEAPRKFSRLFDLNLDVPFKADVKVGERWGALVAA